MTLARTYYVCFEGTQTMYGEAWVEVEYITDANGNLDDDAMLAKAEEQAWKDKEDGKVIWESSDDGVEDVIITDVTRD